MLLLSSVADVAKCWAGEYKVKQARHSTAGQAQHSRPGTAGKAKHSKEVQYEAWAGQGSMGQGRARCSNMKSSKAGQRAGRSAA